MERCHLGHFNKSGISPAQGPGGGGWETVAQEGKTVI
jgi:hypothetical protein